MDPYFVALCCYSALLVGVAWWLLVLPRPRAAVNQWDEVTLTSQQQERIAAAHRIRRRVETQADEAHKQAYKQAAKDFWGEVAVQWPGYDATKRTKAIISGEAPTGARILVHKTERAKPVV